GAAGFLAAQLARPVPSPLRGPLTPHRRVTDIRVPLEDFKAVKNATGGTVNDVVLASVAGGLRSWMHARGLRTEGVSFTACVPIATSSGGRQRVVHAFAPLPVTSDDPRERLAAVCDALADVKASQRAQGADVIAEEDGFNAPTLLAQASRIDLGVRNYDLLVTNIPGPSGPRYVLGAELCDLVPLSFLAGERALAVSCMSYGGHVTFGLLADYDALPDLDVLADGIRRALAELVAATQDPVQPGRSSGGSA
ncbi:MAG: wax ester/triacylglycerol synthase family O-acyltransferase, partial [Solirubrobacterales bacterium]|nr:wax ester/triacylglycerol synthase family O-acyltransferase [Solirubrobacterales bacterium]